MATLDVGSVNLAAALHTFVATLRQRAHKAPTGSHAVLLAAGIDPSRYQADTRDHVIFATVELAKFTVHCERLIEQLRLRGMSDAKADYWATQLRKHRINLVQAKLDMPGSDYSRSLTPEFEQVLAAISEEEVLKPTVAIQDITDLRAAIQQLIDTVTKEVQDDKLRTWLLRLCAEMNRALDEFLVVGPDAFELAFATLIGDFMIRAERYKAEMGNANDKLRTAYAQVVRCVGKLCQGAAETIKTIYHASQIAGFLS